MQGGGLLVHARWRVVLTPHGPKIKFRKALIETKKYSQDEVNEKVKLAYG